MIRICVRFFFFQYGERLDYSATASTIPEAGTWKVGFCVLNAGFPLDNNDFVNGWVIVSQ